MKEEARTSVTPAAPIIRRPRRNKTDGVTHEGVAGPFLDAAPPRGFLAWSCRELRREAVEYSEARASLQIPEKIQ